MLFVRPSARMSVWDGHALHCDHTVHFSADLSLCWIVQCSGHPDTKACPLTPYRFSSSTWKRGGVWMCKLSGISQEGLKIEVKLLLMANRKLYIPRRLTQQRMTLSDFEWKLYASFAISAVDELLVLLCRWCRVPLTYWRPKRLWFD